MATPFSRLSNDCTEDIDVWLEGLSEEGGSGDSGRLRLSVLRLSLSFSISLFNMSATVDTLTSEFLPRRRGVWLTVTTDGLRACR